MADKQSREEVVNKAKEIGKQTEESGKRVGDALKELTVKISVDVDVSDAITGLKAVQREAKEATKALRGVEAQSGDIRVTLDGDSLSKYLPIRASEFCRDYTSLRVPEGSSVRVIVEHEDGSSEENGWLSAKEVRVYFGGDAE